MSGLRVSGPPPEPGARGVDDQRFRFLVDLEVQKSQRLRYCFSIVCLAFNGVSAETREPSQPSFAEIATRYIRTTDVIAPWAPASLALLLVDAETTQLPPILRRLRSEERRVGKDAIDQR